MGRGREKKERPGGYEKEKREKAGYKANRTIQKGGPETGWGWTCGKEIELREGVI